MAAKQRALQSKPLIKQHNPSIFEGFFISPTHFTRVRKSKEKGFNMLGKVERSKSVDFVNQRVKHSTKLTSSTDEDIRALLIYQIRRLVTNLYKDQLTLLEDIQQEHHSSLNRVKDLVSEDFIDMINFLDSDKYGYYRKKVLDSGNETSREIERLLENFEILLKR